MAIEVFNRHENKYMIDEKMFYKLESIFSEYMSLDKYNEDMYTYSISNLYYDTADNNYIRTSIQKPEYKEKLRMRAYDTPNFDSMVFLEIKKKYKKLVNKRRSALTLNEGYYFIDNGELPYREDYMNCQALEEIAYLLKRERLEAKTCLSYERRAFFGVEDSDLRISFDRNVLARRYDLRLEAGIYGEPLLRDDQWLMEIKVLKSMPLWLTRTLSENNVYPRSFSKYGNEYKRFIMRSLDSRPVYYAINPAARANQQAAKAVNQY